MFDFINMQVLIEASIVGAITVLFGKGVYYVIRYLADKFPIVRSNMFVMIFFLTGFFLHVIFEWIGLNSYYCKYGNACKK